MIGEYRSRLFLYFTTKSYRTLFGIIRVGKNENIYISTTSATDHRPSDYNNLEASSPTRSLSTIWRASSSHILKFQEPIYIAAGRSSG